MKKLIIILFAFIAFASYGQEADTLQISSSCYDIDLNDTDITLIVMPRQFKDYQVVIKFPSGNSGTVQLNDSNGVMTGQHAYAAGDTPVIFTVRNKFWIKFSNGADIAVIEY